MLYFIKNKIKNKIKKVKRKIKNKVYFYLNLPVIINEIHYNFIHITALEKYIKAENELEELIYKECKENNIVNPENIKQIINNRKRDNYYKYHNEVYSELNKDINWIKYGYCPYTQEEIDKTIKKIGF